MRFLIEYLKNVWFNERVKYIIWKYQLKLNLEPTDIVTDPLHNSQCKRDTKGFLINEISKFLIEQITIDQ